MTTSIISTALVKRSSRSCAERRGFTLIELLVVVGLIGGLAALFLGQLGGGGQAAALRSAQATVANLVSAAQARALATGSAVRLLVNIDPSSTREPVRYLRHLVVAEQIDGAWRPVAETYLPEGVYVVPGNFAVMLVGLFRAGEETRWTTLDGGALRSTALRSDNVVTEAINRATPERWVYVSFAPPGTTAQSGALVLTAGTQRPPGTYAEGESPVELTAPETVRGLKLSNYGIATLVDGRENF